MKTELKEKATKCKDFVKRYAVGIGVGAVVICGAVLGVNALRFNRVHQKNGKEILKALDNIPESKHCVEFESTTLENALKAIEETFKDVDKNTEVFALIYD